MRLKKEFAAAIAANDSAVFLDAAEKYGVRPVASQPYCATPGLRSNTLQVFVGSFASYESRESEGFRMGGSSKVGAAQTSAFNKADLAVLRVQDLKTGNAARLDKDLWVFETPLGDSEPVSAEELRPVAQQAAYQNRWGSDYLDWVLNLPIQPA